MIDLFLGSRNIHRVMNMTDSAVTNERMISRNTKIYDVESIDQHCVDMIVLIPQNDVRVGWLNDWAKFN